MKMKISSGVLIDLNMSSSQEDCNLENLIYLLQTRFSTITHAINPELVFIKRSEPLLFECWVFVEDKGFYLQPQIPMMTTGEGLNPYRSASYLVMKQLRNWNEDHPTGESLEIPICF